MINDPIIYKFSQTLLTTERRLTGQLFLAADIPQHFKIQGSPMRTSNHLKNKSPSGPGQFPGIAGNAGNHRNDRKFHKSHQILNQI